MISIQLQLEPRFIAACSDKEIPIELISAYKGKALQHQIALYLAAKDHDIVLNCAPTGTGKTKAGLSVLLHNPERNAIYIAPTNALVTQQTEAAQAFVKDANLPHIVKAASAKDVANWREDLVGRRSGEKLYNVLREPATIFPECGGNKPILLITNPDIFYYATFFAYAKLDRGNIASEFYSTFATVIFDEFHLYDAKQLVSLLFYLALSKVFGYFDHNRKIVLLTATPEPACENALKLLQDTGVKISCIDGENKTENMIPSQTAVDLEIRKLLDKTEFIDEITEEVIQRLQQHRDQYGAVILDAKDTVNRISEKLCQRGFETFCGRITGDTTKELRIKAAQKQVILATSTVDVGFNFERENESVRQNLDWLIFSTKDRFAFWQRIGRVGRVLGKSQTDISSKAIAYLPEQAWEQGIQTIDTTNGRKTLKEKLESLDCMKRPFLEIYWRSEAFLEIARPLFELETILAGLPQEELILKLFQTMQLLFNGKKDWNFYRNRIKILQGAEQIAQLEVSKIHKEWKTVKGGKSFLMSFLKTYYPEDFNEINSGNIPNSELDKLIAEDKQLAQEFKEYAQIYRESYAPLFRFRESLFKNIKISEQHKFLIDETGEVNLNPIHLLRYYEFEADGDDVIITTRTEQNYNLKFSLNVNEIEEFRNTQLCKLYAFKDCKIERTIGDVVRPTPLISRITPPLMPGVIVEEHRKNRWAIAKLRKQGLEYYSITIRDSSREKEFIFFPSLSGILAIASVGIALKCPDQEDFYIL